MVSHTKSHPAITSTSHKVSAYVTDSRCNQEFRSTLTTKLTVSVADFIYNTLRWQSLKKNAPYWLSSYRIHNIYGFSSVILALNKLLNGVYHFSNANPARASAPVGVW